MSDLISRTAIAEEVGQLKSIIKECTNTDYYKGYVCALSGVEGMIAQQPTIDAVPVVRGNWERVSDSPKIYIRRCSVCSRDSYTCFSERDYNFCPWCGAKMDGADMRKGGSNE